MSERYSKLFALPENLYASGAPVVIAAGALLKDNQTGKVIAQLKMRNIGANIIKAVKVCIHPLDTVGNALGAEVEYQYLDLAAKRNEEFGAKSPIPLADAATRSYSVSVVEVVFTDNTVWNATDEPWEVLSAPPTLDAILKDSELLKQYRIKYGTDCRYSPTVQKDLWYCVCGELNRKHETVCHHCGKSIANLQAINIVALKAERDARIASEKQKAAEDKAAADAKAKKTKKLAIIAAPIVVLIIVAAIIISNAVKAKQEETARLDAYNAAVALLDAEQYNDAITAFSALGDYKDSIAQIEIAESALDELARAAELAELEEKYNAAVALLEAEQYDAAYTSFIELGDYKDSQDYANAFIMVPVKIETKSSTIELQYNAEGLLAVEDYRASNGGGTTTNYTYNDAGQVQKIVAKLKLADGTVYETDTSTFNADGTLVEVLMTGTNLKQDYHYLDTYTYDEQGNVITTIRVDTDTGETKYEWEYKYTFDEAGNVLTKTLYSKTKYTSSSTVYEYTYNQDGQILYVDVENGNLKYREEYTYGYLYIPQN